MKEPWAEAGLENKCLDFSACHQKHDQLGPSLICLQDFFFTIPALHE